MLSCGGYLGFPNATKYVSFIKYHPLMISHLQFGSIKFVVSVLYID